MIRLEHSVRAYGGIEFKRLQDIKRMNPFVLMESKILKSEFIELLGRILTYVKSWTDQRIGPNIMRTFSQIRPEQEALNDYREIVKRQLNAEIIVNPIPTSTDTQKTLSNWAEFYQASQHGIKALNKDVKNSTELVFFVGGVYE